MLTVRDIREKSFEKTLGFGYRMDSVDSYLKQVAQSMQQCLDANADLEKKIEVLADKLTEYREDEESLRMALLGAQKLGDSVIRESKTKAEIIMREATIKSEAMIDAAKRKQETEILHLEKLKSEVAEFKNQLLMTYKQHLEVISSLPAGEPEQPKPELDEQQIEEEKDQTEERREIKDTLADVLTADTQDIDFEEEVIDALADEQNDDSQQRFGDLRFDQPFARFAQEPKSGE
jgi:cell division initiation protein